MKQVEVVAAIIIQDGKVLATQRGYGDFAGGWEFPGGKVETGETFDAALRREIQEELLMVIEVGERLTTVQYDYADFSLTMHCYLCKPCSSMTLCEHRDACWLTGETLRQVNWLPADLTVVEAIEQKGILR